jgi:phage terminase large subunit GpA-like protein
VRTRQAARVYASVGVKDGTRGQIVTPPASLETNAGAVLRCIVGTSEAKGLIYARLRATAGDGTPLAYGPGVIHFPMSVGDAFFTELTAEHLVTRAKRGGFPEQRWEPRPGVRRNESLDCFVMALAALRVVCPTPARFAELATRVESARVEAAASATAPAGAVRKVSSNRPRIGRWGGAVNEDRLY